MTILKYTSLILIAFISFLCSHKIAAISISINNGGKENIKHVILYTNSRHIKIDNILSNSSKDTVWSFSPLYDVDGHYRLKIYREDNTYDSTDFGYYDNGVITLEKLKIIVNEQNYVLNTYEFGKWWEWSENLNTLAISAFVNNQRMNSKVLKNYFTPLVQGNDYLSSYVSFNEIFKLLNAHVVSTTNYLRVTGAQTGNIQFNLDSARSIEKYEFESFSGLYLDYGSSKECLIFQDSIYYVDISTIRYLIAGSLKQTDSTISLFTEHYVRTDIPNTLDECYSLLDKELDQNSKDDIKNCKGNTIKFHMGLGMWIRNEWIYPGAERIGKLFTNRGVRHPDEISGIILQGYYLYLNGKTKSIDDLIKYDIQKSNKIKFLPPVYKTDSN